MAVYVDKLRYYPENLRSIKGLKDKRWCHLLADTVEELDEFAGKIGLVKSWKQNPHMVKRVHYDITEKKRIRALSMGAIEITDEELVKFLRRK